MKTLLLMRHAKSSWDDLFCPDHERPLSPRGHKAAIRMGEWLGESGPPPDMVLLSSAVRVQQTWEHVRPFLEVEPKTATVQSLYLTNIDFLLAHIRNTKKSVNTLLVINHEPTLGMLTAELERPPLPAGCSRALEKFATGAIARFELQSNWPSLSTNTCRFKQFVKPKDFGL